MKKGGVWKTMDNEENWFQFDDAIVENAGNVVSNNNVLKINQTMDVRVPKNDANDFTYAIRVSSIRKIYKACDDVKKAKFLWAELWLSLSTLLLGAFLSALISQIKYEYKFWSIIFYSVCPALGGIFFVLYFMVRKQSTITATELADIIQENIPNPDEMEE